MKQSNLTIANVAEMTGVSIATISRILNNKGNVKEETRRKVLEAIKKVDFKCTLVNKFKPSGKLIAAVIVQNDNPVMAPFVTGIQNCARINGYHVLQFNCNQFNDLNSELDYILNELPVSGLILSNALGNIQLTDYVASQLPTVMGFEQYFTENISCVCIDDFAASRSAVEYLISIGRKKIVLLNDNLSMPFAIRREEGYKAALDHSGIKIRSEYITHLADFNYNLASNAAIQLLNLEDRPDAFFAITDTFAAAAIKEAKRMGFLIPKDVAIVGFDNTEISSMTDPAITTVSQPSYEIGYQACNVLIEKINSPETPTKQVWINSEFIVRGSTQ